MRAQVNSPEGLPAPANSAHSLFAPAITMLQRRKDTLGSADSGGLGSNSNLRL